jgi:hypothetical protein
MNEDIPSALRPASGSAEIRAGFRPRVTAFKLGITFRANRECRFSTLLGRLTAAFKTAAYGRHLPLSSAWSSGSCAPMD